MIVESLQSAKYEFSDLEDMYLGIVKHGQDTAMMVSELGDTIGMHKWVAVTTWTLDTIHVCVSSKCSVLFIVNPVYDILIYL